MICMNNKVWKSLFRYFWFNGNSGDLARYSTKLKISEWIYSNIFFLPFSPWLLITYFPLLFTSNVSPKRIHPFSIHKPTCHDVDNESINSWKRECIYFVSFKNTTLHTHTEKENHTVLPGRNKTENCFISQSEQTLSCIIWKVCNIVY